MSDLEDLTDQRTGAVPLACGPRVSFHSLQAVNPSTPCRLVRIETGGGT